MEFELLSARIVLNVNVHGYRAHHGVTQIVIVDRVVIVPTRERKKLDCLEVILHKMTMEDQPSHPIISGEIPSSLDSEVFTQLAQRRTPTKLARLFVQYAFRAFLADLENVKVSKNRNLGILHP